MSEKKKDGAQFAVKDRRSGFAIIDNAIIDEYGPVIGAYGLAAYCILVRFARADGTDSYPSYQKVADLMGASRSTAIRAIKKLAEVGLIEKEKRSVNGESISNTYALVDITKTKASQVVGGVRGTPPSVLQEPPSVTQQLGSVPRTHDQDTITRHHNKNKQGEGSKIVAPPPPPTAPPAANKMGSDDYDHPLTKLSLPPSPIAKPPSPKRTDGRKFVGGFIPAGKGTTPAEVWYESFSVNNDATRLSMPDEDDLRHCTDLAKLRTVIATMRRCDFKRKKNIQLVLDWYRKGIPDQYSEKEAGHGRNGNSRGSVERPDRPVAPANYTAPAIQFYDDPNDPF